MIVLTVLRNVALCLLSISSAGGHSADGRRHAPLGGELINILPPLEAVDLNTVAAALETYVNVTAQLQEMDAWKHYRRARDFMRQHRTQLDAGISSRAPAPAAGVSASEERGGRKKKEVEEVDRSVRLMGSFAYRLLAAAAYAASFSSVI
jgi:hypothetical protein